VAVKADSQDLAAHDNDEHVTEVDVADGRNSHRDWVQIGDLSYPAGTSHVKDLGHWPLWGDDPIRTKSSGQLVLSDFVAVLQVLFILFFQ
jgi:hypothetical protein